MTETVALAPSTAALDVGTPTQRKGFLLRVVVWASLVLNVGLIVAVVFFYTATKEAFNLLHTQVQYLEEELEQGEEFAAGLQERLGPLEANAIEVKEVYDGRSIRL